MTIIDELLILLDDLGEAPAEAIPTYFEKPNRQVIFSSLGRLVNRGWVAKKERRQEIAYSITGRGVAELNRILDAIKQEPDPEWNRRWHLVIFDIPESKRKLRDMFRLLLKEECFGIMKSSVWLSPWDKSEIIKRFAKRHNLSSHLVLLETAEITDTYQAVLLAQQSWDWPELEKRYRNFLHTAEKEYNRLKDLGHRQRFAAKMLVFQYAEIVKTDPQLPADIAPNASLARRAHELYKKIRPHCLVENE